MPAAAQADPTNEDLLQKVDELSQKVLVLERKLEVQDEATKTAATTAPVVKASPRGFSLASADSQNQIKLRGVIHTDGRFFGSDDPEGLKDTWQATRVRPIVEIALSDRQLLRNIDYVKLLEEEEKRFKKSPADFQSSGLGMEVSDALKLARDLAVRQAVARRALLCGERLAARR